MTTTITPSSGAGALFTQQGVGTTPGFSALDLRRAGIGGLQEGVLGTGASAQDFMVQQRLAGANMQVEITMPAGGMAAVQGDSIGGQGLYDIPVHSANVLETIGTADPSNPRVDQVILEVQDNVLDASGGNLARTRVLPGTPTGGANLTNRTGAAVLPGSALLLADVLVGAAAGSITNSVIRDRRKWARGAYVRIVRTSNAVAGNDYTTASTLMADVDATNLKPRVECSGIPLRITVNGTSFHSVANGSAIVWFAQDGTIPDSALLNIGQNDNSASAATATILSRQWDLVPAAGSHMFALQFATSTAGTLTVVTRATLPIELVIEEIVRPNAANNIVTTG